MNILIIYPHGNALNPHSGGESRIWNLNRFLIANKHDISILHSIKSIGSEDLKVKKSCNVYYYKDFEIFGITDWYFTDFNPFYLIKLFKIIRKNKIDLIIFEFPWGFISTKLLAKRNTIIMYDAHGVESEFMKIASKNPKFPKFLTPFALIYAFIYEKLVCKLANIIIVVSNIDRNYYLDHYSIDKNKTILIQTPSALYTNKSSNLDGDKIKYREKLGLPKNKTIVIFHGGLPHPPNQEAFDLILNFISPNIKNPEILFVIAGHNVEKFNTENVISLGFVKNLSDLLNAADFAIVPILSGSGMRIKCVDYIIAGIPFITTNKGIEGINYLIPQKDFLVCKTVDDQFLEKIRLLSSNFDLREQLHINLLKKANKFSIKIFENRFNKLFQFIFK